MQIETYVCPNCGDMVEVFSAHDCRARFGAAQKSEARSIGPTNCPRCAYAYKDSLDVLNHNIVCEERFMATDPAKRDWLGTPNAPPSICEKTLKTALELTGGDRAKQHGDKRQNHQNIADLWNAYFADKLIKSPSEPFAPIDVAIMMILVKVARTKSGTFNLDNFVDIAGYAGVAAECADDGA